MGHWIGDDLGQQFIKELCNLSLVIMAGRITYRTATVL